MAGPNLKGLILSSMPLIYFKTGTTFAVSRNS